MVLAHSFVIVTLSVWLWLLVMLWLELIFYIFYFSFTRYRDSFTFGEAIPHCNPNKVNWIIYTG